LNAIIEEASRDGTVRHIGYVPEEALESRYASARIFAYPSR
jgi:glycosyltransferase involved in cell wall biosynthesis